MAEYRPNILVEIYATTTVYRASEWYDDGTHEYLPGLIEFPDFTGEVPDLYYGFETPESVTLRISDTVQGLSTDTLLATQAATEEFRGKTVIVKVSDSWATATFVYSGKITNYTIAKNVVTFDVDMRADAVFDTLLPKKVITAADWHASALDVGKPINVVIGNCYDVPIWNVKNDRINEIYDYVIGYGPIEGVWYSAGQLGVKRNGIFVSSYEYTLLNDSTYPGYAVLRFVREQMDYSGGYHTLTCDTKGLKMGGAVAQRNFASVMSTLFTNTTYGLSDTVDAASWATAVTDLPSADYYCDINIGGVQKPARDYFDEFMMVTRSRLRRGADSEWEISVDKPSSVVAYFGENDGYWNNCEVESISKTPADQTFKSLTVKYCFHEDDLTAPNLELQATVWSDFGQDKVFECHCVNENVTAKKVLSYYKNRALYSDRRVNLRCGTEARTLMEGNVLRLFSSYPSVYRDYIIEKRETNLIDVYNLSCREYSADIYNDLTVTYPTASVLGDLFSSGPGQITNPKELWIPKTADFTAESDFRYDVDASGVAGAYLTMTLPASPSENHSVQWRDATLSFSTKYLWIARNGNKIMGETEDLVCLNDGDNGVLVYLNATIGWHLL